MNQINNNKPFKRKTPFNNGFKKPMLSEPLARISYLQHPTAAKRQTTKPNFTKPHPKFQNAAKIPNPWKVF